MKCFAIQSTHNYTANKKKKNKQQNHLALQWTWGFFHDWCLFTYFHDRLIFFPNFWSHITDEKVQVSFIIVVGITDLLFVLESS